MMRHKFGNQFEVFRLGTDLYSAGKIQCGHSQQHTCTILWEMTLSLVSTGFHHCLVEKV